VPNPILSGQCFWCADAFVHGDVGVERMLNCGLEFWDGDGFEEADGILLESLVANEENVDAVVPKAVCLEEHGTRQTFD